jgi:hypothetical protein
LDLQTRGGINSDQVGGKKNRNGVCLPFRSVSEGLIYLATQHIISKVLTNTQSSCQALRQETPGRTSERTPPRIDTIRWLIKGLAQKALKLGKPGLQQGDSQDLRQAPVKGAIAEMIMAQPQVGVAEIRVGLNGPVGKLFGTLVVPIT